MPENLVPFRPIQDRVLVYIYDDGTSSLDLGNGTRLITGLRDTDFDSLHDVSDGRHPGLRPRWAMIIGVNEHTPDFLQLGDKVLLDQLKWRRGVFAGEAGRKIWDIPVEDILLVDDAGLNQEEMEKCAEYLAGFENGIFAASEELKSSTNLANWQ